jgi:hypothetical protein
MWIRVRKNASAEPELIAIGQITRVKFPPSKEGYDYAFKVVGDDRWFEWAPLAENTATYAKFLETLKLGFFI